MKRAALHLAPLLAILLLTPTIAPAATDAPAADDHDTVFLPQLVITEKTRGVVPLDYCFFYNKLTRTIITELVLTPPMPAGATAKITFKGRRNEITGTGSISPDLDYDQHLKTTASNPANASSPSTAARSSA